MKFNLKKIISALFSKEKNIPYSVYGPPPDIYNNTEPSPQTDVKNDFDPDDNILPLVYDPPRDE